MKATDYWKAQADELLGKKKDTAKGNEPTTPTTNQNQTTGDSISTPQKTNQLSQILDNLLEDEEDDGFMGNNDVLDDSVLDVESDFFAVDRRKATKNNINDNTGDYFDVYTGEYLGSDGTGNKIRFSSKALWKTINNSYSHRRFAPPELAQSGNICFGALDEESWNNVKNIISDRNVLVKIVEHYYNKLGFSFDELDYDEKSESHIFDESNATASIGEGQKKMLKLLMNLNEFGTRRLLQNADDITNILVHERMGHGEDFIKKHPDLLLPQGEGKFGLRLSRLEGRATVTQIKHPSWKNTSLIFKQHMYDTYGQYYVHPNNLKAYFFDYGVKRK
jgi:hypothetical protein